MSAPPTRKRKWPEFWDNLSVYQRALLEILMSTLSPQIIQDLCMMVFDYLRRPKAFFGAEWMDETEVGPGNQERIHKRTRSRSVGHGGGQWHFYPPNRFTDPNTVLQCNAVVLQRLHYGQFGCVFSVMIDEPDTIHKWYDYHAFFHTQMRESISSEYPEMDADLIRVRPICTSLPSLGTSGVQPSPIRVGFLWCTQTNHRTLPPFYVSASEPSIQTDAFALMPGDPLVIGIRFSKFAFHKEPDGSFTATIQSTLEWAIARALPAATTDSAPAPGVVNVDRS